MRTFRFDIYRRRRLKSCFCSGVEVATTPLIGLTAANTTVQLGGNYTLVMADAGPVGTDETKGQTRHWLVNGVTLSGSRS